MTVATTRKASTKDAENDAPDPEPLVGAGLGQVAYEAYSASVGGKSVDGKALPTWDEQVSDKYDVAAAWCVAAQAVITATIGRKK